MKLQLKFFASVREKLGTSGEPVDVPDDVTTVGELRALLVARGGAWAEALGEGRALRTACNQTMCDAATPLSEGAEVAFFPPVTGG
ncbi:molybdopterin synthase sulfur carrier subunit [Pseudoduganella lurida]|uniref:Molybdopterin synthase sulfur carrier subunit n=1 Tax=Pseudoduganella lurida TaxID=1036180 RepID=A0A562RIU1_9BURK|nr:molybdopterin converting factor subunit 1 [Pseudoduganella lurida]TWI68961.1 molybdopterin synthase sulfur carrier subunit [Pseudoduganella lurida]